MSIRTGVPAQDPTAPLPVVIVGAGPAGLATAGCLKQRNVEALVLEAGPSLANSWRNHYDRLHLHTVKQQSQLPGLPFAKELPRYVSRADFVAYLESYAARFSIAPRTGEAVRRVERGGRRFRRRERPRRLSRPRPGRRHRIQPYPESGAAPRAGAVSRPGPAFVQLPQR